MTLCLQQAGLQRTKRFEPGNLNVLINVETTSDGEDLACADWSKND